MARSKKPKSDIPFTVRYSIALLERFGMAVTVIHRTFGLSPAAIGRLKAKLGPEAVAEIRRDLEGEDGQPS